MGYGYSKFLTGWKALKAAAAALGFTALGALFAVQVPEEAPSSIEGWVLLIAALVAGALKALENWRKNSGQGGVPRFEWPWGKAAGCLLVCCLVGCATARTETRVIQEDPDGFSETLEFSTEGIVTWGSKQELQEGDLAYQWREDGGYLNTGGSAERQQAADPVTATLVQLIERLMERVVPEPSTQPEGAE